jgi:hypothetical protein
MYAKNKLFFRYFIGFWNGEKRIIKAIIKRVQVQKPILGNFLDYKGMDGQAININMLIHSHPNCTNIIKVIRFQAV